MRRNLSVFFTITVLLFSACSTVEPTATSTPPKLILKTEEKDVYCPSDNEQAREAYNKAKELSIQTKQIEAERLCRQAIELDPKYCDAMDNLGLLLRRQGRIEEAIVWYKKSLAVFPDNTVAIQNLAVAYRLQGKSDEAIAEYEKLTPVAPDNPEGYFGLGSTYLDLQRPEQAITYLKRAEELYIQNNSPYVVDTQYYLGFAYYLLQDCQKAKAYLEPIYSQLDEDGGINYVLGACYIISEPKDLEMARKYIFKAQELGVEIPVDLLKALENGK